MSSTIEVSSLSILYNEKKIFFTFKVSRGYSPKGKLKFALGIKRIENLES